MIQKFQFWVFNQRKKPLTLKDICSPIFLAALFIIAKYGNKLSVYR